MATRQWGVTPPISTVLPTRDEMAADDDLIEELKAQNNFEQPRETERREQMLQLLQNVTLEFVKAVGLKKGLSPAAVEVAGGKIFAYGSYRLGVYGPGSDIDTLVLAPKHVLIDDFFSDFPPLLQKMAPKKAVEKLTPVPDAFVPIIFLEMSGVSIDLIFARLAIPSVPMNLDLKNNDYLRGLDESEVRSLNGTRVTDEILELVPQQKTFRLALRAVKLWAQSRAIYANIVGFPGGVAWAILVARVCQLYPQATGSMIVRKFFRIINKWAWPQPVLLKPIEDGILQMKVWNPKIYHSDRFHLMPIITPAYPSMCATHNISVSTKTTLLQELQRGGDIIDKVFMKQLSWNELFTRHTFFTRDFKYYLGITALSKTKEAESAWSGLVESKLRHFVKALDQKPIVSVARPFPKGFERTHVVTNAQDMDAAKNGWPQSQAKGAKAEEVLESSMTDKESQTIYTTTYYIGLGLKLPEPGSKSPPYPTFCSPGSSRSLDISTDCQIFKSTCTSWPDYQPEVNDLAVSHVRNFDLPEDVFLPGEPRPSRPKRVVRKTVAAAGQKRSIDELTQ